MNSKVLNGLLYLPISVTAASIKFIHFILTPIAWILGFLHGIAAIVLIVLMITASDVNLFTRIGASIAGVVVAWLIFRIPIWTGYAYVWLESKRDDIKFNMLMK